MRPVLALLLFLSAALLNETAKAEPRWCSISNEGSYNCSYTSMDQCRSTVSGTGGSCMPEAPVGHLQPRAANARCAVGAGEPEERQAELVPRLLRRAAAPGSSTTPLACE
jgi:hypothetical protein